MNVLRVTMSLKSTIFRLSVHPIFQFKYVGQLQLKLSTSPNLKRNTCTAVFQPDDITQYESSPTFDLVVIGGGIVGITTARAVLIEKPNLKVAVLEKEPDVAVHQSGHNSGVIHAGIYYKPESLKAKLCVAGLRATYDFCEKHKVPYKKCGKVIVATEKKELIYLQKLYERGLKNKSPDIELIDADRLKQIEPHCRGLKAIYSPHTGIIDWGLFTKYCAADFQRRGGVVFCNFKVTRIREAEEGVNTKDVSQIPIEFCNAVDNHRVRSKYAIACGGLYSDKVAELSCGVPEPVIIPFRGEYLELKEEKRHLVKGNIYPVPDPKFPFLGVHFTPRLDGSIWMGPNAILALSREGYSWKDINWRELFEMVRFRGFRQLARNYASYGRQEMFKSFFLSSRVKDLQKYIPEIKRNDIVFRGSTGVRAQAIDEEGRLIDELILQLGSDGIDSRILHLRNAPSPAATSSLALSEYIVKSANVEFEY